MCLIRWFTSVQGNANTDANPVTEPDDVPRLLTSQPAARGVFLRNRKSCPLCRAAIVERPAEIWSIKSMVANLIKSKLVDLPSAPPPSATETPNADGGNARDNQHNDPWRNVFHRPKRRGHHHHDYQPHFFPPPPQNNEDAGGAWNVEDMGMYDAEDGGIYRCLECLHEIWGGVCTHCHREYAGHARFDDDDYSEAEDDMGLEENFLGRRLREIWDGYAEGNPGRALGGAGWLGDSDEESDDGDELDGEHFVGPLHPAWHDVMDLTDESMSDAGSDLDGNDSGSDSGSGEDDGVSSEGSWSSDGEDDHHHLLDHRHELIEALHGIPNWPLGRRFRHREPGVAHIEEVDGDDDEEDEDGDGDSQSDSDSDSDSRPHSGDEEDSFIDDDEEDGAHAYHLRHRGQHHRRVRNPELVELFDSDGDDEPQIALNEDDNAGDPREIARQLGRGMRLGGGGRGTPPPPPVIPVHARRNGRRRENLVVVDVDIDIDDDHGEDRANGGGGRRRGAGLGRIGRRRVVHDEPSEEDGDEDEDVQEVRPAGRRRGNARRRVFETDADDASE
ncbi:hypothetical protein P691DRAFT_801117 [Macrolepiota fuliginosa MF-IS2]|uniref:Uncharacterized protein n=1 Tax=Macrolepiota fuliginosa MF-IS2 TaxID=1400762 RepID=A0A9P5XLZ7_9AGAR|nr:hypothetical protein P691DRAFT_801117 [Macrolepiota fuliginosa MF-IS2]